MLSVLFSVLISKNHQLQTSIFKKLKSTYLKTYSNFYMQDLLQIKSGFGFSRLIVYQKAKAFYLNIKSIINNLDLSRIYRDQLIRAALSIPLNIAESSGRSSPKDRRRFLVMARGSLFECIALIDVLLSEKQITLELAERIISESNEISKILFVMAENLKEKADNEQN